MTEVMFDIPDQTEAQAELNKPALEVGNYLAVVTKVETKENPVKGSVGLNFTVLVNRNRDSITEGWDGEAEIMPMQYYVYIGKKNSDGKVVPMDNNRRLASSMAAFGISGKFAASQVMHRQVIVKIIHDPSLEDQEQVKLNPEHVVERYFAKVDGFREYKQGDVLAPVLKHMAEQAEAQDSAPAAEEY